MDLFGGQEDRSGKKIILRRRHHFYLDVAVWKEKSPCRHVGEVVDAVVVALIFNIAAMEKMIPPCPLAVAGEEEEEEIKPRY